MPFREQLPGPDRGGGGGVAKHAISNAVAQKRPLAEGEDRSRAITGILAVVARHFAAARFVQAVVREEGPLDATLPSILAVFAPKSTGTIVKRAASLRLYDAWHASAGLPAGNFLDEDIVFKYARHLQTIGGPPTRASAACSALSFLGGLFDLDAAPIRKSARIFGVCTAMLRDGLVRHQRRPLSVAMVKCLEQVLLDDAGVGSPSAVIAGGALFCVYARLRVGDLRRCSVEPVLDIAGATGFIETKFVEHKTAKPGTRRSLPVAAPAFGLLGPWAVHWMSSRGGARLDAAHDGSVIPALASEGGWHAVPYTTNEFAKSFRTVLHDKGFSETELVDIGAHSLKATCLSWASKFGIEKDKRRHLGSHVTPGDRVVDLYGRDTMAAPLRSLVDVISAIKDGTFDPDATRSGAFRAATASTSSAIAPAEEVVVPTSSSSSSTCSDAEDTVGDDVGPQVVKNVATGMLHMTGSDDRLACGKVYPHIHERFRELPAGPRCPRCFGSIAR